MEYLNQNDKIILAINNLMDVIRDLNTENKLLKLRMAALETKCAGYEIGFEILLPTSGVRDK